MTDANVLILDNGAGSIKAGYYKQDEPIRLPNATAKVQKSMQYLISDQIEQFNNGSLLQFNRPFDRGYLNNWQCEIEVWSRFFNDQIKIRPQETSFLFTEPPLNPTSLQNDANEVVFEYFGFKDCLRRPAMWFSAYGCVHSDHWDNIPSQFESSASSCTVVDSGFSFTHVAPFVNLKCQKNSIRRINIGGKLLTNFLKELVSYRQWNMMDEFILINQVKEALCYVSNDPVKEMQSVKGLSRGAKANTMTDLKGEKLRKNFVLPDFQSVTQGFVKPDNDPITPSEQVLVMETERFCAPELLFQPSDISLAQAGLPETCWQSLQSLHEDLAADAVSKLVLTGGNTKFYNFRNRFETEFRPLVPDLYDVQVYHPPSPDLFAWQSARRFVSDLQSRDPGLQSEFISREVYLEYGHHYCNEKFQNSW